MNGLEIDTFYEHYPTGKSFLSTAKGLVPAEGFWEADYITEADPMEFIPLIAKWEIKKLRIKRPMKKWAQVMKLRITADK